MRLIINSDYDKCSRWAADYVAYKIKASRPTKEKPFVMAIPAGSSPLGMFKLLIEMFKKGKISFQNVVFFNMVEYVGLPNNDIKSFHYVLKSYSKYTIQVGLFHVNSLVSKSMDIAYEIKLSRDSANICY